MSTDLFQMKKMQIIHVLSAMDSYCLWWRATSRVQTESETTRCPPSIITFISWLQCWGGGGGVRRFYKITHTLDDDKFIMGHSGAYFSQINMVFLYVPFGHMLHKNVLIQYAMCYLQKGTC